MNDDAEQPTSVEARPEDKAMLNSIKEAFTRKASLWCSRDPTDSFANGMRIAYLEALDIVKNMESEAAVQQRSGDGCACGNLEGFVQWMEFREHHACRLLEADDLVEGELRLQKIRFAKQQALNYINARRQSNTDEAMDS